MEYVSISGGGGSREKALYINTSALLPWELTWLTDPNSENSDSLQTKLHSLLSQGDDFGESPEKSETTPPQIYTCSKSGGWHPHTLSVTVLFVSQIILVNREKTIY